MKVQADKLEAKEHNQWKEPTCEDYKSLESQRVMGFAGEAGGQDRSHGGAAASPDAVEFGLFEPLWVIGERFLHKQQLEMGGLLKRLKLQPQRGSENFFGQGISGLQSFAVALP